MTHFELFFLSFPGYTFSKKLPFKSCIRKSLFVRSGMASQQNGTNGAAAASNDFTVKAGLAQMLKGGVIMDVVNPEQVCMGFFLTSYRCHW